MITAIVAWLNQRQARKIAKAHESCLCQKK
jgi:hypothetical protein